MTPAERILGKALVASPMKSADWSSIQAGLRDRAFFSATVDDARRLAVMREAVSKVAAGELDESQARLAIREALERTGYQRPDDVKEGSIRDLYSQRRLDLIIQTNVAEARGYVRYLEGTSEGALAAFPCQELVRTQNRKAPRNWPEIWKGHGGSLYGSGRMIALKTDPIWTAISRFGHPWPPFDFGSGMGVRDVGRREAIRYGVISPDDPPPKPPKPPRFNDGLAEPLPKGESKPVQDFLQERLGSQVSVQKGMIRFNANLIQDMLDGKGEFDAKLGQGHWNPKLLSKISDPATRERVETSGLTVTRDWMREHGEKHRNPSGKGGMNLPLTDGDYELIPSIWRQPDDVAESAPGRLDLTLDTLDGGRLFLGIDLAKGRALTFQKRRREP